MAQDGKKSNYHAFLVALKADAPGVFSRIFPKDSFFWKILDSADPKLLEPILGFRVDQQPGIDSPWLRLWVEIKLAEHELTATALAKEAKVSQPTVSRFLSGERDFDKETKEGIVTALTRLIEKKLKAKSKEN